MTVAAKWDNPNEAQGESLGNTELYRFINDDTELCRAFGRDPLFRTCFEQAYREKMTVKGFLTLSLKQALQAKEKAENAYVQHLQECGTPKKVHP